LRDQKHQARVRVDGGTLLVDLDGKRALSAAVTLPPRVLVGFTGANGGLTDRHAVSNVSIVSQDAQPDAGPDVAAPDAGIEAAAPDAGTTPDAAVPDAPLPDAGPEAAIDAGAPDAPLPDAASSDAAADAVADAPREANPGPCTGVPPWAPKDGWWLWTTGDRVQYPSGGGKKLYRCTNVAFCNDAPDGPWGKFGWTSAGGC
jgi:hypothetical protein